MTTTFYDVLEVAPAASQAAIQGAYRQKVKEYHPDVSDHPDASELFRVVVRAEEILGDPDERSRYDDLGHDAYLRVTGRDGLGAFAPDGTAEAEEEPVWGAPGEGRYDRSTQRTSRRTQSRGSSRTSGARGPSGATGSEGTSGSAEGSSNSTTSSSTTGGSASGGRGGRTSGYDPWDRTKPGSGNPTQRGYAPWNEVEEEDTEADESAQAEPDFGGGTGTEGEDLFGEGPGFAGGRARTSRPGRVDGNPASRRRRARAAQAAGGGSGSAATSDGRAGGFWAAEATPDAFGPEDDFWHYFDSVRTQSGAILTMVLLMLYPVFVFFSVTSALPTTGNLVVGAVTAMVVVFMLTEPGISLVVFGWWGLVAPLFLLFIQQPWFSPLGLVVLGAFWVPLVLTGLFAKVLPT